MKTVLVLLLLALICSLHHHAAGQKGIREPTCCPGVTKKAINATKVKNWTSTPEHCVIKAIIVTVNSNKKVCVDRESDLAKFLKSRPIASAV
ncbi:eotaxin-like [Labrus bergylta]|uniref:eotaxin-like n=1 Tax=Labrus bergylta TaxID=56723 RepID=UPI003313EA68